MAIPPNSYTPATELKIAHIAGLMRRWKYTRIKTATALAEKWGVSYGYVKDLAQEASRRVRAEVRDVEACTDDCSIVLRAIVNECMRERDPDKRLKALRVAVDAAKAWGALFGGSKVDIGGTGAAPTITITYGDGPPAVVEPDSDGDGAEPPEAA